MDTNLCQTPVSRSAKQLPSVESLRESVASAGICSAWLLLLIVNTVTTAPTQAVSILEVGVALAACGLLSRQLKSQWVAAGLAVLFYGQATLIRAFYPQ
jgi:hypothetical protein